MSRQIALGERELTEDEVTYLRDRGWGNRIELNDQLLAERAEEGGDLSKLKVDELRELADEEGVEIPADSKKADIVRLIEQHREEQG